MVLMSTDRLSIGATRDVHDVAYDVQGVAYCKMESMHHWKSGEEHWSDRSKYGYITFGDRHLGMAVEHRIAVKPGEGYESFWTRMRHAEDRGFIDTMQTSAYSLQDKAILEREVTGLEVEKKIIEKGALTGGLSPAEEKEFLNRNADLFSEGVNADKPGLKLGMGGIGLIFLFAIGYLLFWRGGKK